MNQCMVVRLWLLVNLALSASVYANAANFVNKTDKTARTILPNGIKACQANHYHSQMEVDQIIDGDTIRLKNGQLLRLIGINTPEINYKKLTKSEPLAIAARDYLRNQIGPTKKVNLVLDTELVDKYNRLLAHVFSLDGDNLQQLLINQGYANAWVYGDNRAYWACYRATELQARQHKKGIWQYPKWQAKPVKTIKKTQKYHFERIGRINRSFIKDNTLWLVLDEWLYVGIKQNKLERFKDIDFNRLINQKIIVELPVYYKDKHWRADLQYRWQITTSLELDLESM